MISSSFYLSKLTLFCVNVILNLFVYVEVCKGSGTHNKIVKYVFISHYNAQFWFKSWHFVCLFTELWTNTEKLLHLGCLPCCGINTCHSQKIEM